MDGKIFVKPKEGMRVTHPETGRVIADEGETVNDSPFWRRRIMDGDVELLEKAPAPKKMKTEEKGGDK